jgi:hypothetical protein
LPSPCAIRRKKGICAIGIDGARAFGVGFSRLGFRMSGSCN